MKATTSLAAKLQQSIDELEVMCRNVVNYWPSPEPEDFYGLEADDTDWQDYVSQFDGKAVQS